MNGYTGSAQEWLYQYPDTGGISNYALKEDSWETKSLFFLRTHSHQENLNLNTIPMKEELHYKIYHHKIVI